MKFWDISTSCKVRCLSVCPRTFAKTAAKWPKMIGFRIFKCLWNSLIEMLQGGGEFQNKFLGGIKNLPVTKHNWMS